jgi:hypothetical protein
MKSNAWMKHKMKMNLITRWNGIHHVMKVTTYMKNDEMDKIDITSNAMAT